MSAVVVVGAGPAGIRAAQTLVAHGLAPVLLDESARGGGQIYRQQPGNFRRPSKALYGFEAGKANALHGALEAAQARLDYRPDTLVWNAEARALDTLSQGRYVDRLAFDQVIVATGATDRILPVPGWTLPGVYSLGAAQVALKFQGCAIGSRPVLAGTGPLLYLVAYQYAKAGAKPLAVLDSAPFRDQAAASPALLGQPATFAKGLYYRSWLALHGVPVHQGAELLAVEGERRVAAVRWRAADGEVHRLECDALGFGQTLRSETQLADLLGCDFAWSALNRAWLPVRDPGGRSSQTGVYLAGDGAGIQGADAAELAGELAALSLLDDRGVAVDGARIQALQGRLARFEVFRQGLEGAFPFPADWAAKAPDEVTVCRCEQVSAGEIRAAVAQGHWEINRVKATCRVGMGRCQGRICGAAAAELIACASGRPLDQIGRLRAQAPIKPLPFGVELAP